MKIVVQSLRCGVKPFAYSADKGRLIEPGFHYGKQPGKSRNGKDGKYENRN